MSGEQEFDAKAKTWLITGASSGLGLPTRQLPDWLARLLGRFSVSVRPLVPLLGNIRNAALKLAEGVLAVIDRLAVEPLEGRAHTLRTGDVVRGWPVPPLFPPVGSPSMRGSSATTQGQFAQAHVPDAPDSFAAHVVAPVSGTVGHVVPVPQVGNEHCASCMA